MLRRRARYRYDAPTPGRAAEPAGVADDHEERTTARAEWEDKWSQREEERVARWLGVKGNDAAIMGATEVEEGRHYDSTYEFHVSAGATDMEAAPDVLTAEVTNLEGQRRQVAEALDALGRELALLEERKADLLADLSSAKEQRRRLDTAVEMERNEVERLHAQWAETKAGLEAEVSGLQERRACLVESMESAVAATQQAQAAERQARDALDDAKRQAIRLEAEQFALWEALEVELKDLEERRRQLGGSGG